MTIALLTAAGRGTRMGQAIPKQFLSVNDKPLLVYTLERFQKNREIDAIAVVTLPDWFDELRGYARQFGIDKLKWIVPGGATGQASIHNGLKALARELDPAETVVMIHDGNRPLVSEDVIHDSLAVFKAHGSAIAAIPCVEVAFTSADGCVARAEIPRESLWRTQTPHTFRLVSILRACDEAVARGFTGLAAMCQLMAKLGAVLHFSKGSEKNLKLTTLDDLEIFKALLVAERSAAGK